MKRVGIVRGGTGENYGASLVRGGDIILHIHEHLLDKYKPLDILIDRDGVWHLGGLPIIPGDLIHKVDVIWNTAHSQISAALKSLGIPHIGSHASELLQNNKEMLREHVEGIVPMPKSMIIPVYQADFDGPRERYSIKKAKEIHEKFSAPWVVKSLTPDRTMGVHVAKTFPELVDSIEDGVNHGNSLLIEELIMGKIASVHSLSKFRNEDIYTFPLGNAFGNFSQTEKDKLIKIAKALHHHMNAGHYLKSDFVVAPRGKVYLLNIESHPNIRPDSHFHQAIESVGAKMHHVIEHILNRVL